MKSGFLARWSRLKHASRTAQDAESEHGAAPAPKPVVADDPTTQPSMTAAELPPIEDLQGIDSDYQLFMQPNIDEDLKRTALKRLFSDPHFNQMDGLDVYIDDYSKPDPLPAAMLAALNHARGLLGSSEPDTRLDSEVQTSAAVKAAESASALQKIDSNTQLPTEESSTSSPDS